MELRCGSFDPYMQARFLLPAFYLAAVPALPAVLVIDNLDAGPNGFASSVTGPTAFIPFSSNLPNRRAAFTFTTPTYPSELAELRAVFNVNVLGSPIEAILSTGPVVPGGTNPVSLASVTPASVGNGQILDFTPTVAVALAPNTQYWVDFVATSGGGIYTLANTDAPMVEPGWTFGTSYQYTTAGGWSDLTPEMQARVSLDVIPESHSFLLVLGGISLLVRRKTPARA